jgi:hypothetical protein
MYVAMLPLRLVAAAWEIANRASEFLFIGVGAVVAMAWVGVLLKADTRARRATVALLATVLFVGGAALGWSPEIRLSQALRVAVGDTTLEPQGLSAARWTRRFLPGDERNTYAANGANSRLLMSHGRQPIRTGGVGGADLAIDLPLLEPWQIDLLREKRIRYVLMDRRAFTDTNLSGYFFPTRISPSAWDAVIPSGVYTKFDRPTTSRLYDSGDVVLYDIRHLLAIRRTDG